MLSSTPGRAVSTSIASSIIHSTHDNSTNTFNASSMIHSTPGIAIITPHVTTPIAACSAVRASTHAAPTSGFGLQNWE
jgi:hypothetical protein